MPGQIIGELSELGQSVASSTAQIPKDIAGKAMESLGTTSGKTQGNQKIQFTGSFDAAKANPNSTWEKIDQADAAGKQAMARKALEELLGRPKAQKEESIWEKLQREEDEKKKREELQKEADSKQLQPTASKRPAGDLYGTKAKKLGSEIGKNARQD